MTVCQRVAPLTPRNKDLRIFHQTPWPRRTTDQFHFPSIGFDLKHLQESIGGLRPVLNGIVPLKTFGYSLGNMMHSSFPSALLIDTSTPFCSFAGMEAQEHIIISQLHNTNDIQITKKVVCSSSNSRSSSSSSSRRSSSSSSSSSS